VGGNAEGVLGAGVRHIEVVLVAGDADSHDRLVGRPGSFSAASDGIAAYRAAASGIGAPVAITGRIPVCRHSAPHLGSTILALAGMGAVAVRLCPVAGARLDDSVALAARQTAIVNGVWLEVEGEGGSSPVWRLVEADT